MHKDNYEQSLIYLGMHIQESKSAYEAALVAYALSQSKAFKTEAFNKLKSFATTVDFQGKMHCLSLSNPFPLTKLCLNKWCEYFVPPLSISKVRCIV